MISNRFTEEVPRIEIADVRSLLPTDGCEIVLDLDVSVHGRSHSQVVTLTSTRLPRRGGRRWWWRCPLCGGRRAHLYLLVDVRCRVCSGVKYSSQYFKG